MLNQTETRSITESEIYMSAVGAEAIEHVEAQIREYVKRNHSLATISFYPPKNVFEVLFSDNSPDLVTRIRDIQTEHVPLIEP